MGRSSRPLAARLQRRPGSKALSPDTSLADAHRGAHGVQVSARFRRREPRCRKRQSGRCRTRNEADGGAIRSSCTRHCDCGRFRLRVLPFAGHGTANARTAKRGTAAYARGGARRRFALSSCVHLVGRQGPGRAFGRPSQSLLAGSQTVALRAALSSSVDAGQSGWSFAASAPVTPEPAPHAAGHGPYRLLAGRPGLDEQGEAGMGLRRSQSRSHRTAG